MAKWCFTIDLTDILVMAGALLRELEVAITSATFCPTALFD